MKTEFEILPSVESEEFELFLASVSGAMIYSTMRYRSFLHAILP